MDNYLSLEGSLLTKRKRFISRACDWICRFRLRADMKRLASRRERIPGHPILRNAPQTTAFFPFIGEA